MPRGASGRGPAPGRAALVPGNHRCGGVRRTRPHGSPSPLTVGSAVAEGDATGILAGPGLRYRYLPQDEGLRQALANQTVGKRMVTNGKSDRGTSTRGRWARTVADRPNPPSPHPGRACPGRDGDVATSGDNENQDRPLDEHDPSGRIESDGSFYPPRPPQARAVAVDPRRCSARRRKPFSVTAFREAQEAGDKKRRTMAAVPAAMVTRRWAIAGAALALCALVGRRIFGRRKGRRFSGMKGEGDPGSQLWGPCAPRY